MEGWCGGVGQAEFVEVMQVGDAEVEWGEEDKGAVRGGGGREEVQGDDGGAEEEFFGDGAGEVVPETLRGGEECRDGGEVGEVVVDEDVFVERAGE